MDQTPSMLEKAVALEATMAKLTAYLAEKRLLSLHEEENSAFEAEVIFEAEPNQTGDELKMEDLEAPPAKLDDLKADVQDPTEEVNLGTEEKPRPVWVCQNLPDGVKAEFINLLHEFKDCFAWEYEEMPGLSRRFVEHKLPIKEDYKPFKQAPRRMDSEIQLKVKEEIEHLLKVGFIRPTRYVDWLSNIVPVMKKNGKIRVCIDFRNLNLATPKDEYPMPVVDLLVDGAAKHKVLSLWTATLDTIRSLLPKIT